MVGTAIKSISHKYTEYEFLYISTSEYDLTSMSQTRKMFNFYKPNYVIHLAACVGGLFKNMSDKVKMLEDNMMINFNVVKCSHEYKVEKLVAWIQVNIKRQPVISLPNAISTLENRTGDCNEHAALLAAFCRAVGIPAKIETGLVYLNGSFYYHAWNSVFVGRWITVDALFNQIPADVTHIAFSSGNHDMQLDILGLIGRVKIEILD